MSIDDRILEEVGKANAENRNICAKDLERMKICAHNTMYRHIHAMIADGRLVTHTIKTSHGMSQLLYLNNGESGTSEEIIIRQNDILIGLSRDILNKMNFLILRSGGKK